MAAQTTAGELVTLDIQQGVAVLTWNRPDRRNSWTASMEEEYFALLRRCTDDPDVRAIVVTGAGETFCPAWIQPSCRRSPLAPLRPVRRTGSP